MKVNKRWYWISKWRMLKTWMWLNLPCVRGKELARERQSAQYARGQLDDLRKEIPKLKQDLERVNENLFRIKLYREISPAFDARYRVVIDISKHFEDIYMYGNDQKLFEYIGEHVGHLFVRELRTMNFERFEHSNVPRRQKIDFPV